MGEYEQSNSEARHGYKASTVTASEYLRRELSKIDAEQERKERYQKNIEIQGTKSKAWKEGIKARLSADNYELPKDYYPSSIESFVKGYVYEGTEQIRKSILFGLMTEVATNAFYGINDNNFDSEKYGFTSRKEFGTVHLGDFLYAVGYNDAVQGIIDFDKLPIEIQQNKIYRDGFEEGYRVKNSIKKGK